MPKSDKSEQNQTLRPLQEQAAVALAGGMSLTTAARRFHLARSTLWTWLRTPLFAARVAELRKQTVDRAMGRMTDLLTLASKTYRSILMDASASAKLKVQVADSVFDRFQGLLSLVELRLEIEKIKGQLPR